MTSWTNPGRNKTHRFARDLPLRSFQINEILKDETMTPEQKKAEIMLRYDWMINGYVFNKNEVKDEEREKYYQKALEESKYKDPLSQVFEWATNPCNYVGIAAMPFDSTGTIKTGCNFVWDNKIEIAKGIAAVAAGVATTKYIGCPVAESVCTSDPLSWKCSIAKNACRVGVYGSKLVGAGLNIASKATNLIGMGVKALEHVPYVGGAASMAVEPINMAAYMLSSGSELIGDTKHGSGVLKRIAKLTKKAKTIIEEPKVLIEKPEAMMQKMAMKEAMDEQQEVMKEAWKQQQMNKEMNLLTDEDRQEEENEKLQIQQRRQQRDQELMERNKIKAKEREERRKARLEEELKNPPKKLTDEEIEEYIDKSIERDKQEKAKRQEEERQKHLKMKKETAELLARNATIITK